jgi:Flp pilus assembly protein TadG
MRRRQKGSKERGSNIVEMAVIMTALLTLVLGVIDLGRAMFMKVEVANAARAGALYGAQGSANATDAAGIKFAVDNESSDPSLAAIVPTTLYVCQCVGGGNVTCGTSGGCGAAPQIGWLTVNASVVYVPWFKVPGIKAAYLIAGSATVPVAGL